MSVLAVEQISDSQLAALGFEQKLLHLSAIGAEVLRIGNARQEAIHRLADARVAVLLGDGSPTLKAEVVKAKAMHDALGLRMQTLKLFSSNLQTQINAVRSFS